jgi:hypothetical protein
MNLGRRVLAASIVVFSISPAYANDHFARVNEVLLSFGGDGTKQFIEIEDTANEAFAGGGYSLFVYSADGTTQVHNQQLALSPGVMRVTLGSPSAFTQFGLVTKTTPPDLVLNLQEEMPANGTACFRKSGVDLHCLSWGTATAPAPAPTNGRVAGPSPMDSMSIQRQPSACAGIGAPTPNAANATLPCMDPPVGGDAGMGGDAGTMGGPPDDSCSASSGGSWFGFVATASLFGFVVRRNRRRVA